MSYSTPLLHNSLRLLVLVGLASIGLIMAYAVAPISHAEENPSMQPIDGFPEVSDAVNNQSIQEKVNYGNRFIWKEKRKSESPEARIQRQRAFEDKLEQRQLKPQPSNSEEITRKLKPREEPNIVIQD
jgi:hypothetical protein